MKTCRYNKKLTDEQAREVVQMRDAGVAQKDIAKKFKVSRATVSNIVTRKLYRLATEEL